MTNYNNIDLYKHLVYSNKYSGVFDACKDLLVEKLLNYPFGKKINIFEEGPGGGWITIRVISEIVKRRKGAKIYYTCVEHNQKMYKELIKTIKSLFEVPDDKIEKRETEIEINTSGCNFKLHNKDFDEYIANRKSQYDIVISFFFLHHLNDWQKGLSSTLNLLKSDGVIIFSEITGDHAAWSYSYDKLIELKNIEAGSNDNRLKYLKYIKIINDINKGLDVFNLKPISASRIDPVLELLEKEGYTNEIIEHIYDNTFTLDDWLKAGGIYNSNERIFSVFPDSFTEEDLPEEIKNEKDIKIKAKDKISFNILKRNGKTTFSYDNYADLYNYFSELYPLKNQEEINFNEIISNDIRSLLNYNVIQDPAVIFPLRWDIKNEENNNIGNWDQDILIYIKNDYYKSKVALYNYVTNEILSGFKITDFIYRELIQKCIVEFRKNEKETFIDISLDRGGALKKLIVHIKGDPIDSLEKEGSSIRKQGQPFIHLDRIFYNKDDKENILDEIKKKVNSLKEKDLNEFKADFKSKLLFTNSLQNNSDSETPEDNTINNFFIAGYIAICLGITKVGHYPSKDSIELSESEGKFGNKEIAGGGYIIYFDENTKVDENNLIPLLNLRNRAIYLKEFQTKATRKIIKQNSKIAIISILVDSFAHNISAHSLAALKWWFEVRHNILDSRFAVPTELINLRPQSYKIEKEKTAKDTKKYYDKLGLTDSSYDEGFYSLYDFLQFVDNKTASELFSFKEKVSLKDKEFNPRIPVPVDYALYPFFRYLRDKGAFWSGVTRDMTNGGEIKTLYDILWKDFANNPLYLGTIAKSEGITKLNIKIALKNHDNDIMDKNDFVKIDLSVIDYEEKLSNSEKLETKIENEQHIAYEETTGTSTDESTSNIFYSKYAFVRLGKDFKILREKLETKEFNAYLPGGVVGEHALFTIFENTIRNIKHYKNIEEIKKNGINFWISIDTINERKFDIATWLGHETNLLTKDDIPVIQEISELTAKPVYNKNGLPRLGGNSQDKACAAMLYTNKFISVEDTHHNNYPWVRYSTALKNSPLFENDNFGNYYKANTEEKKTCINEYKKKIKSSPENKCPKGYLKKHFYLWKGAEFKKITTGEDIDNENISRFKFSILNVQDSETKNKLTTKLRRDGIIRVLESENDGEDTSEKPLVKLYQNWLKDWFGNYKHLIFKESNNDYAAIKFNESGEIEDYIHNKVNVRALLSVLPIHEIKFSHGGKEEKCSCNVRSHGHFWNKFFKHIANKKPEYIGKKNYPNDRFHLLYEFSEIILTKIVIFDNRLYDRLVNVEKDEVYKTNLNLEFYKEGESNNGTDDNAKKNYFKEKFSILPKSLWIC